MPACMPQNLFSITIQEGSSTTEMVYDGMGAHILKSVTVLTPTFPNTPVPANCQTVIWTSLVGVPT